MVDVFFMDPETGDTALFVDPGGGGQWDDINAPMNRPAKSPLNWLSHLYFHSSLDPMEVAVGPQVVNVSHASIPAGSGADGVLTWDNSQFYGGWSTTHTLLNHGLGYPPDFLLLSGSNVIHPGYPIQFDSSDGRSRCVTAYATSSQILLYEFGIRATNAMAAVTVPYTVIVLRRPPAPTGNVMFEFEPDDGLVRMGKEKFRSDRRYLQVVAGGSPFGLPTGKTIDLKNGTFRSVAPNGSARDVVPSTFRVAFGEYFTSLGFGPDGNYNGSFSGTPSVQVQAP
jgi:hypothetical protein